MDRRDFLRTTGGLAAAAGCAAIPASAQPVSTAGRSAKSRVFACPWSASPAGFADDGHRIARRLSLLLAPDGLEVRFAASIQADFVFSPVQSDVPLHPAFAFFAGLPGHDALAPRELESWLLTGGGQELWDDLGIRHGFKPLLAGHTGSDVVLWSRVRIEKPEDLAGLRVVARGLDAEVVRALGAVPVTGDDAQLETAIVSEGTDAVIWGSLVHASAAGIPSRFPNALTGALGSAGSALALRIDHAAWQDLTPAQQSAIAAAAVSEFNASLADAEATRSVVEGALTQRFGVTFARPAREFSEAVSRIATAVIAHTAAHDSLALRINQSYAAYRRAVAPMPFTIA
jgi:TRAP-type mannitol/chloroaromatic compound transport system substrate-binding protein